MIGCCLKCIETHEVQETEPVTMKNGRPVIRDECGECGTTMFKIGTTS